MIKLICRPEHEAQLREKLKPFDALDLTLVEKGVDYDSIGILFQMEDLAELTAFLNHHFLQEKRQTLTGQHEGRTYVVALADVLYIEGLQRETFAYTASRCLQLNRKLYQLQEELYPRQFIRISKSYLVNLAKVEQIAPSFNGRLTLVLSGGVQLEVSRSYAPHFRKAIGMEGKD